MCFCSGALGYPQLRDIGQIMASSSADSGGKHLARKSVATQSRAGLPKLQSILVVEDEAIDAERMNATMRVLFGYDVEVRRASTLGGAVDMVLKKMPDLVLLDDILKPNDTATQSIPYLQRAGYDGPIVVVSGQVTRQRRAELKKAGAAEVIHKDSVDSVELAEMFVKVFGGTAASGQSETR
jgi:DNA-binding NarL/FixJ family response regulator